MTRRASALAHTANVNDLIIESTLLSVKTVAESRRYRQGPTRETSGVMNPTSFQFAW